MINDYRDQYNMMRPKIRKQWIKIIVTFLCFIPYIAVIAYFTETYFDYFVWGYGLFYLNIIFGLLRFKCPNCSKSLYVRLYLGNFPFIVQTRVSKYCNHCGVSLK